MYLHIVMLVHCLIDAYNNMIIGEYIAFPFLYAILALEEDRNEYHRITPVLPCKGRAAERNSKGTPMASSKTIHGSLPVFYEKRYSKYSFT